MFTRSLWDSAVDAIFTPAVFTTWVLNLFLLTAAICLWVTTGDDPGSWSR